MKIIPLTTLSKIKKVSKRATDHMKLNYELFRMYTGITTIRRLAGISGIISDGALFSGIAIAAPITFGDHGHVAKTEQVLTGKTLTGTVVDQYNSPLNGDVATLYDGTVFVKADTIRAGTFTIDVIITGIDDNRQKMPTLALSQNYPNTFNPTSIIEFPVDDLESVTPRVYNILGHEIKTLVDRQLAQINTASLGAETMNRGQSVAAGVYIYQLIAGNKEMAKKMILKAGRSSSLHNMDATVMGRLAKTQGNGYHLVISGPDLLDKKDVPVDLSGDTPIDIGTIVVNGKPIVTIGANHIYDLSTKYSITGHRLVPIGISGLHVYLQSDPSNVAITDSTGNMQLRADHLGADSIFIVDTTGKFYSWKDSVNIGLDTNKVYAKTGVVYNYRTGVSKYKNDTTGVALFKEFTDKNGDDLLSFIERQTWSPPYPFILRIRDADLPIKVYMSRNNVPNIWYADTAMAGLKAVSGGRFRFKEVGDSSEALLIVDYTYFSAGHGIDWQYKSDKNGPYLSHWKISMGNRLYIHGELKAITAHEVDHVIWDSGVHSPYESDMIYKDALTRMQAGEPTRLSEKEQRGRDVIYDSERNFRILNYFKK